MVAIFHGFDFELLGKCPKNANPLMLTLHTERSYPLAGLNGAATSQVVSTNNSVGYQKCSHP